jgi:hypothetical protein
MLFAFVFEYGAFTFPDSAPIKSAPTRDLFGTIRSENRFPRFGIMPGAGSDHIDTGSRFIRSDPVATA